MSEAMKETATQQLERLALRPKVYGASKLDYAAQWRDLADRWSPKVDLHARWPTQFYGNMEDTPENARVFWTADIEDVMRSDAVLVVADLYFQRPLRGALIEAGVALGQGKPVFVVGESKCYGTWQYFPGVIRCKDIEHALDEIVSRWIPAHRAWMLG